VFIKVLAFGVPIDPDIRVQAHDFSTPEAAIFSSNDIFQTRLLPETLGEGSILDLEAVIYADGFPALGLAGGSGKSHRFGEEADVGLAQCGSEKVGDSDDLVGEDGFQFKVHSRHEWGERWPLY